MLLILRFGYRLGGEVIERPPRVRDVVGSIPCRAIPKTFKMEVMAVLFGAEGCGVSITTDYVLSG